MISSCFATSFLSFYLSLCVLPSLYWLMYYSKTRDKQKCFHSFKRDQHTRDHGRRQHAIIFVLVTHTHTTTTRLISAEKRRDIKTKTGVVIMWLELNWFFFVCFIPTIYMYFVCMKEKKNRISIRESHVIHFMIKYVRKSIHYVTF